MPNNTYYEIFNLAVLPVIAPVVFWIIYGIVDDWLNTKPPKSWNKFEHF